MGRQKLVDFSSEIVKFAKVDFSFIYNYLLFITIINYLFNEVFKIHNVPRVFKR